MQLTTPIVIFLIVSLLFTPARAHAEESHGVDPDWGPEIQVSSGEPGVIASGGVGRKIAVDGENRIHLVWTEQRGVSYDIYYSRSTDGGLSWSAGRDLFPDSSPLPAMSPNIAVGPDGTLHLAWIDRRDGPLHVYYSRSFDAGDSWEAPRPVSAPTDTLDASAPSLSIDTRNRVHIAWHTGDENADVEAGAEPARVYYARSTDGGVTFEPPRQLSSETGYHAAWPRFDVKGTSGDVIAIPWRDNRGSPDWDIYLAISIDGGATFTEVVGPAGPEREWDPDAYVDARGTVHLTYTIFSHGAPPEVVYRRAEQPEMAWTDPVTLSEARSQLSSFAVAPEGGVLWVWWKDERDAPPPPDGGNPHSDIAARYTLDGGETWSELEFVTDLGDTDVRFPSMAIGPDGRAHLMWSDRRSDESQETVFVKSRQSAPVTRLFVPLLTLPGSNGAALHGATNDCPRRAVVRPNERLVRFDTRCQP